MAQKSRVVTRLEHSYALSPVTALAFYEVGPDRVYDSQTCRLLGQLNVFHSQPVHGIYVSQSKRNGETKLLIWGGRSALITGQTAPPRPVESYAPDWIYDGILFPDPDPDSNPDPDAAETSTPGTTTGALVTAHNEILPLTWAAAADRDRRAGRLAFGPLTSPSRPILYSASLALLPEPGAIVVWKYHHADRAAASGSASASGARGRRRRRPAWEVLFVFTGHEGRTDAEGAAPVRLLASCSDDRTVRVWDITERAQEETARPDGAAAVTPAGEEEAGAGTVLLDGARETGFGGGDGGGDGGDGGGGQGGNSEAGRESAGDSARCVAFGRALLGGGSGTIEIYSFGEDCSRQKWELDLGPWREPGSERKVGTLRHCGASTCHDGKNIWSAAVLNREGAAEPLTATGGADGKIVVSGRLGAAGSSRLGTYEDLDVMGGPDSTAVLPTNNKAGKHAFQRYAFLLFLATMGHPLVWQEVRAPDSTSPAKDTAVIGSASGRVYLFHRGEIRELASLPEKVSDIILLGGRAGDGQPWSVLVNILGLDHAVLLRFDPSTNAATIDARKVRLPEHYIVTAAAFCGDTLVLGSRTDTETNDFIPLASRKDCKTKDAITCILPIPGTPAASQTSFLTTCRDGKYRIYNLVASPHNASLNLQHEIVPPLNTLEGAFFTTSAPTASRQKSPLSSSSSSSSSNHHNTNEKSQLILHGFRGPNFITYNASTRSIISSIPCGGAHRPFTTIACPHDPGQMRFVFSKAGELRIVSQSAEGERVLRAGGHGREIKSVSAVSFSLPSASASAGRGNQVSKEGQEGGEPEPREELIATAAEDTSIRIWRHHRLGGPNEHGEHGEHDDDDKDDVYPAQNPSSQLTCLAVLQGHSAGIQALRFANGGSHLISSAGSEELFVWRVSRIRSSAFDALAVVREAVWGDDDAHGRSPDKDLRIVDFDVASYSPSSSSSSWPSSDAHAGAGAESNSNEPTTSPPLLLITMALSDSSVRSYVYRCCPPEDGSTKATDDESPAAPAAAAATAAAASAPRGRFSLLATGRYTGACPTQVRHLRVGKTWVGGAGEAETETETEPEPEPEPELELHVLTAFTDGHVAVWKKEKKKKKKNPTAASSGVAVSSSSSSEFCLALVVRLHQSSIKSLDLSSSSWSSSSTSRHRRCWLVATGGDDNALGLTELAWDAAGAAGAGYVVRARYRVRDAHAAAVTGLALVGGNPEHGVAEIATVSNDQREEVGDDPAGGMRVALLQNRYSSVADAGDLELVAAGKLMVGGVGMELWDISCPGGATGMNRCV
ncbi:hypothetical protein L209DRAFT_757024 [Thermothelomyces heterothallicus CBS 203.75]